MSFLVKYDDITNTYFYINNKISEWNTQMESIASQLNSFSGMQSFQGAAADGVRSYLSDVHYTILVSIGEVFSEFYSRLLLYKDGYYQQIDSNLHAELDEDTFNQLISFFPRSQMQFEGQSNGLSRALCAVSDILPLSAPSTFYVNDGYNTVYNRVKGLKEKTENYEWTHAREDFKNLRDMLSALKSFISEYRGKGYGSMAQYESGSIVNSVQFQNLYHAVQKAGADRAELNGQLQDAIQNEQERMLALEKEWADERAKNGVLKWLAGAGAVIVGTVAIVCTAGAATPLVVAGVVAGAGSIAYGAANIIEANQDIAYGLAGDPYTAAWNPIRDTIFMGNQEAYDIWGNANTFVAGLLIPIGTGYKAAKIAGTSIPRAIGVEVVKDSVSAASGYVAGELGAYCGTEWFGPEAGKWIGLGAGILAGCATSAGLNKIDSHFNLSGTHSFIEGMSPQDAERYQKHLDISKSTCDKEDLYAYLNKIDSDMAETYLTTGKWPDNIQIPKNSGTLKLDGSIDWGKAPKGGYTLDVEGKPIKDSYNPQKGEIIDRYGTPDGRYTSPVKDGNPYTYDQRSLPYVEEASQYHQYEVVGDFSKLEDYVKNCPDAALKTAIMEDIDYYYNGDFSKVKTYMGEIAPIKGWGTGGGIQYEFPIKVEFLEKLGLLKEIQ